MMNYLSHISHDIYLIIFLLFHLLAMYHQHAMVTCCVLRGSLHCHISNILNTADQSETEVKELIFNSATLSWAGQS